MDAKGTPEALRDEELAELQEGILYASSLVRDHIDVLCSQYNFLSSLPDTSSHGLPFLCDELLRRTNQVNMKLRRDLEVLEEQVLRTAGLLNEGVAAIVKASSAPAAELPTSPLHPEGLPAVAYGVIDRALNIILDLQVRVTASHHLANRTIQENILQDMREKLGKGLDDLKDAHEAETAELNELVQRLLEQNTQLAKKIRATQEENILLRSMNENLQKTNANLTAMSRKVTDTNKSVVCKSKSLIRTIDNLNKLLEAQAKRDQQQLQQLNQAEVEQQKLVEQLNALAEREKVTILETRKLQEEAQVVRSYMQEIVKGKLKRKVDAEVEAMRADASAKKAKKAEANVDYVLKLTKMMAKGDG